MSTKIFAPHYLRLEREMRCDIGAAWRALTDLHEMRAWWGIPVCHYSPDVGGGFEVHYAAQNRLDTFTITRWEERRRIGGRWQFSGAEGHVDEMVSLVPMQGHIRVTIEQGEFPSFGDEAVSIFGHHKIETRARLDRLQEWLEQRIPANLARMPLI